MDETHVCTSRLNPRSRYAKNPEAPPLGRNYLTKFIKRYPELGAAISNRRDRKRAIINPRVAYEDFFSKVALYLRSTCALLRGFTSSTLLFKGTIFCLRIRGIWTRKGSFLA